MARIKETAIDHLNEKLDASVLEMEQHIIGKKLQEMAPRLWAVDFEEESVYAAGLSMV